jgi:hypothetical protein
MNGDDVARVSRIVFDLLPQLGYVRVCCAGERN